MIKKVILLALAITVSACSTLQNLMKENIKEPEITYKNLSIGQLTRDKIELKPTFSIANNNGFIIPIDKFKYELSFNQKTMVKGETDEVGDLPANQSTDVTLGIDLTKDTLASIKDVLFKEGKIDYVIKGEVEVLGFKFPFEKASTLFKPSVSLGKLEIKKAGFKQIDIVANVTVGNKNDFTLPLDLLSYSVSSGANQLVAGSLKDQSIKQGTNQLKIPLSINPSKLFSSVFSLLQNPKLPLSFNFSSGAFENSVQQTLDLESLFGPSGDGKSSKQNIGDVLQGLFN
ncbi:MAG: LEA14-like dessication related protein [Oleispira sp.]|jgi:LEA14-like dessication related protein